ncbi:MAG: carbamoyltransferase HypF, partial [Sporomusaceae bacterium]|nr:carbamoyltransferase HypF [Sporomusaceae bacterium]
EGSAKNVAAFLAVLPQELPPLAVIADLSVRELPLQGGKEFSIQKSAAQTAPRTLISPDVATCPDCLAEITDPKNRRCNYAFTNCTNCGPRYTIVTDVPYDRQNTTMHSFAMCETCQAEYENPANRRFHAQPNACPVCGPHYRLLNKEGAELPGSGAIFPATRQLIAAGAIVAIKGIGGWHLAADAHNETAVDNLRQRKIRDDKPLAVMAGSLAQVKKICQVSKAEEELLTSPARPIVLLPKSAAYNLVPAIAPGNGYVGVMLPYAPMHGLLLNPDAVWVMTSGNLSDEPTVYQDEEALKLLAPLADYYLIHNREIFCRADDSVSRIVADKPFLVRRSRGYVPLPIKLKTELPPLLAVGGELKNTFCLTRGQEAFLSAHMGDLENLASYNAYLDSIEHLTKLLYLKPTAIAYDPHPEYLSTKYALSAGLTAIPVQHHHAHIAAVMAEHHLTERVIGIAFDGTGYGTDGALWGGEFLLADLEQFTRVGQVKYAALPGGTKAIKEPWRPALWTLFKIYGENFTTLDLPLCKELPAGWELILQATSLKINAPLSSSAGRLFDIAAALLGVRFKNNYEGQAAIELELLAQGIRGSQLPYEITCQNNIFELDFQPVFAQLCAVMAKAAPNNIAVRAQLAADFHTTLAYAILDLTERLQKISRLKKVVLSGGVFQNITLLSQTMNLLQAKGFTVYLPRLAPPNDGGLSLGQAAVAGAKLLK